MRAAIPSRVNGPRDVLEAYVRGKDGHRPDLAAPAFADDARLEVVNHASTIAFPATTEGRDAIVDVLVTQFGRTHTDVRSFYLGVPGRDATRFACDWLVGMRVRADGGVRVGCGRYDWTLRPAPAWCATALTITIDAMQALPASAAPVILGWLRALPYPWTSAAEAVASAPPVDGLARVLARLRSAT